MSRKINTYKGLLKEETAFFDKNRDELLLKYPNRYLLVHGTKVEGNFKTRADAVAEGVRKYGTKPFLVRRSGDKAPVITVPALNLGILSCRL